jgi:hypothetical protein
MKRHESLQPLSRDHHNVLVHARRLRGLDARFDPETSRRRFLSYFASVLRLHFDEEEAILAPLIGDATLRQRFLDEHADLRRRAESLPAADAQAQVDLGQRLREHVRFEEDVLFPHLETLLGGPALTALAAESHQVRLRDRPGSLQGDEACFL